MAELRQALLDAIAEEADVEAAAEALAAAKPPRAAGSSELLKVCRDPVHNYDSQVAGNPAAETSPFASCMKVSSSRHP